MRLLLVTLLTLVGVSFGSNAYAGDAGCGLGSVIISKNSKLLQLFAMTTNATFISQAFGITSGTSGCSSSGIVKMDRAMEYFVEVNQQDLSREMAQGEGEKLNVLAGLSGCETEQSKIAFAELSQSNFEKIVPSANTNPAEMVQNLKREVSANKNVAHLCHVAAL